MSDGLRLEVTLRGPAREVPTPHGTTREDRDTLVSIEVDVPDRLGWEYVAYVIDRYRDGAIYPTATGAIYPTATVEDMTRPINTQEPGS